MNLNGEGAEESISSSEITYDENNSFQDSSYPPSTSEESEEVALEEIVGKNGGINWSATIVDLPVLGYSDQPKLHYNVDVIERFFVDFVTAPDSPISSAVAATLVVRATKNGLLKLKAISAVAPT